METTGKNKKNNSNAPGLLGNARILAAFPLRALRQSGYF